MQPLKESPALREFNRRLGHAERAVFLLDYDGTLAPFGVDIETVRPWPGVPEAIDALAATERARIIVVTGRSLTESPPVLGTRDQPEIWGSHGRERLLPDGRYEVDLIDECAQSALAIVDSWAALIEEAGGRWEAKPGSRAFHWRGLRQAQKNRIRKIVTEGVRREAFETVLDLADFDGGIELRAPGADKGSVVRTILREAGGDAAVAYLGDDSSDEDAFRALRGRGLGVLVRAKPRSTAADIRVDAPAGLIGLLTAWSATLGRVGA